MTESASKLPGATVYHRRSVLAPICSTSECADKPNGGLDMADLRRLARLTIAPTLAVAALSFTTYRSLEAADHPRCAGPDRSRGRSVARQGGRHRRRLRLLRRHQLCDRDDLRRAAIDGAAGILRSQRALYDQPVNAGDRTDSEYRFEVRYGKDASGNDGVQFTGLPGTSGPVSGPVEQNLDAAMACWSAPAWSTIRSSSIWSASAPRGRWDRCSSTTSATSSPDRTSPRSSFRSRVRWSRRGSSARRLGDVVAARAGRAVMRKISAYPLAATFAATMLLTACGEDEPSAPPVSAPAPSPSPSPHLLRRHPRRPRRRRPRPRST